MRGTWKRDLVGGAVHQLGACQLLDQVGIAAVFFHQGDTMLQPQAVGLHLGQLLLPDAQLGLGILKRKNAAIAPDGVGPEIADHRQRDRRNDQDGEKAGDRTLDSHPATESQSDSVGQGKMGKGFKELSLNRIKPWLGIFYNGGMRRTLMVLWFATA